MRLVLLLACVLHCKRSASTSAVPVPSVEGSVDADHLPKITTAGMTLLRAKAERARLVGESLGTWASKAPTFVEITDLDSSVTKREAFAGSVFAKPCEDHPTCDDLRIENEQIVVPGAPPVKLTAFPLHPYQDTHYQFPGVEQDATRFFVYTIPSTILEHIEELTVYPRAGGAPQVIVRWANVPGLETGLGDSRRFAIDDSDVYVRDPHPPHSFYRTTKSGGPRSLVGKGDELASDWTLVGRFLYAGVKGTLSRMPKTGGAWAPVPRVGPGDVTQIVADRRGLCTCMETRCPEEDAGSCVPVANVVCLVGEETVRVLKTPLRECRHARLELTPRHVALFVGHDASLDVFGSLRAPE